MVNESAEPARRDLPESCTAMPVNLVGLLCFFGALCAVKSFDMNPVNGAVFAVFALAAPIIVLECVFLKTYRRPSAGLDFSRGQPADPGRVAVKLIGLYFTLGLAALYYWIFPEYRKPFYDPYWRLIMYVLPAIIIGAIPYFAFLDRYSDCSADPYWHMGALAAGRWAVADKNIIAQHLLGWLVKIFFLAVMFSFFAGSMSFIKARTLAGAFDNFGLFYGYVFSMIFAVDLVFVCAGYLLTLRILDSHMRSVEPTSLGWTAALVCYRPFWDWLHAVLNSLQLLAVNVIYVIRAGTEERHLSKDPVYAEYSAAMDSRSVLKIFAAKILKLIKSYCERSRRRLV